VLLLAIYGRGRLPARGVQTNDDLSDERPTPLTPGSRSGRGIKTRHTVRDDEPVVELAVAARAARALEVGRDGGRAPDQFVATTRGQHFPATAASCQRKLGAPVLIAFDVRAAGSASY
jgi:3-oxoacyl-[acyl-carrier-protein] synthase-3